MTKRCNRAGQVPAAYLCVRPRRSTWSEYVPVLVRLESDVLEIEVLSADEMDEVDRRRTRQQAE